MTTKKALERPCPECGAKPGQPCKNPPNLPVSKIHGGRFKLSPAQKAQKALEDRMFAKLLARMKRNRERREADKKKDR